MIISKNFDLLNTNGQHVEVYELLIHEVHWDYLLSSFQVNGFSEIPDGVVVIDEETGMIRLRLASLIKEE